MPLIPRPKRSRFQLLPMLYAIGLTTVGLALVERLEQKPARPAVAAPLARVSALPGADHPEGSVVEPATTERPALALRPGSELAARTAQGSALEPETEEPEETPNPELLTEDLNLIATSKVTWVYSKADRDARKLGFLRTGAVVRRSAKAAPGQSCAGGWYRVEPEGYVCVGEQASLEVNQDLAQATARRPEREAALPYHYGRSRNPPPHFYSRVPTLEEQRQAEPDLVQHLKYRDASQWLGAVTPMPEFLQGGRPSLRHNGARQSALTLSDGQAVHKSGFALLTLFESAGRAFGLTTDLAVVPLDRLERVEASRFHGLPLHAGLTLPVVFIRSKQAVLYDGDPKTIGLSVVRPLEDREVLAITGRRETAQGRTFLETKDGQWILDQRLTRIDPLPDLPRWARAGDDWIDISIQNQTLVAYQGEQPVFVTLVSTGVDGLGDPLTTHSTVQGHFRVHTKHVSTTMDSDTVGDEYDLRDVPYVQYFHEGYALHGVYWHDGFGAPRSHGCINLSPLDARWLFGWTSPTVPTQWHGAMSHHRGTQISIHP